MNFLKNILFVKYTHINPAKLWYSLKTQPEQTIVNNWHVYRLLSTFFIFAKLFHNLMLLFNVTIWIQKTEKPKNIFKWDVQKTLPNQAKSNCYIPNHANLIPINVRPIFIWLFGYEQIYLTLDIFLYSTYWKIWTVETQKTR